HHADASANECTDELAHRPADKNERQRQTDNLNARSLCSQYERQESEEGHACRTIDHANRQEQRKCKRPYGTRLASCTVILSRQYLGVAEPRHRDKNCHRGNRPESTEDHQRLTPRQHDEHESRGGWENHFPDVTGEIVSTERFQRAVASKGMRDK